VSGAREREREEGGREGGEAGRVRGREGEGELRDKEER
jgi:hypothetical protein